MTAAEEHPTARLLPFVQGELEEDDARAVQDHLDGCESCADEERGLRALLEEIGAQLDDLERARLHHAVIAATGELHPPQRAPFTRRLAPYLGTAAVLALLAVGVMVMNPAGEDADLQPGAVQLEREGGVEDTGVDDSADAGIESEEDSAFSAQEDAAAAGTARSQALSAGPTPLFEPAAGRMSAADLHRLGRSGDPFQAVAETYDADAAAALQPVALDRLTQGLAPSEADLVRNCTRAVLRTSAHDPIPVYGGYGSLDGEEVLLLGFAWTPSGTGPLDRFMVWAWPRGSCESPLVYRWGWIDR